MGSDRSVRFGSLALSVLFLLVALVVFGGSGAKYEHSPTTEEIVQKWRDKTDAENRKILEDVRKGGYVIFLRHAKTDWSQKDIEPFDFSDRSKQRNLSPEGREQAAKIGETYRALNIPVSKVVSSPFFRCRDTAELAFGDYHAIEIEDDLMHVPFGNDRAAQKRTEYLFKRLQEMLAQAPAPGTNTVLVGHSPNLVPVVDIRELSEGNTVICKPDGKGSFKYIGMILADQLFRLL